VKKEKVPAASEGKTKRKNEFSEILP